MLLDYVFFFSLCFFFFFQAEDGIRDFCLSRGLGDVYKRQEYGSRVNQVVEGICFLKRWSTMTRVLLYSDEPILAKGLDSVLRQIEGFELLPTSNTLASLMEQITQGAPDLVLMDLTAEITFAVLSDMKPAMNRSRFVLWV